MDEIRKKTEISTFQPSFISNQISDQINAAELKEISEQTLIAQKSLRVPLLARELLSEILQTLSMDAL